MLCPVTSFYVLLHQTVFINCKLNCCSGLPIFEVRAGGCGSSNDGNMARRVLRDHPDLLAEQTGVPLEFIKGIYVIWVALASKLPIDPEKFQSFCNNLKQIYVENVPWYPLSPTLHKVLEHGWEIISLFPESVTSGILSEEPAEASNKDVKKFQKQNARQDSPVHRNLDVFQRQMDRSDPKIVEYYVNQRKLRRKSQEVFPNAVLALCKDSDQIMADLSLNE